MGTIIDDPLLRERRFVFNDRHDAGRQLGELMRTLPNLRDPVVLAIPAGGVPIGTEIARAIHAGFALAVVRKIQIPGNTEAGFGAVTWDNRIVINELLLPVLGMRKSEIDAAVAATRKNVSERLLKFTAGRPFPDVAGKTVILADDGLASGFTMLAAIQSLRELSPGQILVAVPTASRSTADSIAEHVDTVICLNIRSGPRFAVAEAYKHWFDMSDNEVIAEISLYGPGKNNPDTGERL
jgi:putative phosphoribosyl transferase